MTLTPYATLNDVKTEIKTTRTAPDNVILGAIRQVSQRVDRMFYKRAAPFFAPFIETRNSYRLIASRVNSWDGTFIFGDPLLSLSGVIVGTQTLVVGTNVQLFQSEYTPYDTLQLVDRCCNGWYRYLTCGGCPNLPYVTITGTWGYNVDYANAWLNSGQTITSVGGIDNDDISFTVTDVDAANSIGITPALSSGNVIQIDSEWLIVLSTDTTTNAVTVQRGVNGSTAAAHNQGTAIYVYQVEEGIRRAVARQIALQIAKIGAYDDVTVADLADAKFAVDVLAEFKALLSMYSN